MAKQLNYAGDYDFPDLVTALENKLKATDAWKDTYASSTGQMIIEFYAYVGNMVLFYLERRAEEAYWATAQNKSSLINLSRLINYTPKRRVSSVGALQFSLATVSTKRVFIPQYTECQTVNDVKFVTIRDTTIEPGQLLNTADAIQGELVTEKYTGDGLADQEYNINSTIIENDDHTEYLPWSAITISVDGVIWTKVTSFISSGSSDTDYILRTELNETLTIIFGDGVKGQIPEVGSIVQVKYINSVGADGNVFELGKVITINDILEDEDSVVATVTVTNSSTMSGGDAAESTEEIRAEAPNVFATGDRLVTKKDFNSFIINYGGVADVNSWGEAEESAPNYNMFNVVRLCILLGDFELPSISFKTNLSNSLYEKSMVTVKYEYITAEILDVFPDVELYVNKGNALSQTQSDVDDILADQFVLGSTTKLGVSKFLSNLIEAVDALNAISYHHMTLKIRKVLSEVGDSGGLEFDATLEATPILAGSIDVYIGSTIIATDDELGAFIDNSSTYTVSGTVDYTTGAIDINVSPVPSGIVSVRYEQNSNGDIIVNNNQICRLFDVNFSVVAYIS